MRVSAKTVLFVAVLTVSLSVISCGVTSKPAVTPPQNNTAPSITTEPSNQTVTAGQPATFSVSATGTAPLTYQWMKNGAPIASAIAASYTTASTTTADNNATFSVTVSNTAGSVTSNTAILTVSSGGGSAEKPSITAQPSNQTVTAGQTATFSVSATGTAPLKYQWMKNGSAISGATGTSYTTPATNTGDNNADFTVAVSNSAGSVTSNAATLTVKSTQGTTQTLITLSSNGRYLVNGSTGQPVFIVGDDAFDLCCMLSASDVSTYLNDRAGKGFNVIWMAAVDNGFSANAPKNFSGNYPFDGSDFTNFDSTYWANIDSIITQASNLGITVFLNPFFPGNGSEPGYLNSVLATSDATMSAYGTFLGNRYKGYDNIVWLLGGDSVPSTAGLYQKLDDVGAAISAADPNHLITVEACESCATNGQNSIEAFLGLSLLAPSWLKLNWAYPQLSTTVAAAQNAYNQSPFMPPMCGENFYELEHSLTELNVRFEQYAEVLSGCYAGRIFGNGAIWSFDSKNGSSCCTNGSPTWQSQLSSAGSLSQEYQGKLFRSREHWLLAPDTNHTVVTAGYGSGLTMTTAARTSDGQTIIAYIPNGNATTITVNLAKITSSTETIQGWWFNPRTGTGTSLGTFPNSGTQTFTAPDSNDWVLVLDDASVKLAAPGTSTAR